MKKIIKKATERILRLPVQRDTAEVTVAFSVPSKYEHKIQIRFARDRVDFWGIIVLPEEVMQEDICFETSNDDVKLHLVEFRSERSLRLLYDPDHTPATLHFCLPTGELSNVLYLSRDHRQVQLVCNARMYGTDEMQKIVITAKDISLFDASLTPVETGIRIPRTNSSGNAFEGDIEEIAAFSDAEYGQIVFCRSTRSDLQKNKERRFLSIPIINRSDSTLR